ncbi:MAG: hypothetical protein CMK59_04075 [Proteobacteria bacterium]|nr:hypothetical protein [Pseudomonadota bacterium]
MSNLEFQRLRALRFFERISDRRLESASLLWEVKNIPPKTLLWLQGEPAEEFAFVVSGLLEVHIAEAQIATIGAGEMLGEAAVFTRDQRTASISSIEETELIALSDTHLQTLKKSHPEIYDLILECSLERMARRVHEMGREIAKLASGDSSAPVRKEESAIGKFWKRLTGAGAQTPPSGVSALKKLPKLKEYNKNILNQILKSMTAHFVAKNQPVFLEGEQGDSVFVVAEGCIEVKRNVRGGKAETLASLYPGALFGTGSLLLRERRNAACVAGGGTDAWVYELNREAHNKLAGEGGRAWREALIAALAYQLRNADDRLIALKLGGTPSLSDYDAIRGDLAGYQG